MQWKWVALISLLAMGAALGATGSLPAEEYIDDGPDPGLGLMLLLAVLLVLVLVGVGLVVGLFALAVLAIFTALGVISSSVLLGLYRQRFSSGLRAFHYQICALAAFPAGMAALWLATRLFELPLRLRYVATLGGCAGICGGLVVAYGFDRLGLWIYTRLVKPRWPQRPIVTKKLEG